MDRSIKILAVNPNTSNEVTLRFVAEARLALPPGVALEGVTGHFGAAVVSTFAEDAIASHSALDLLARHGGGFDGVILAISFDTALEAAREVMPVPVVGITEAAIRAARRQGGGGRVGVVTFGSVSSPLYQKRLAQYGVTPDDIETIDVANATGYLDADRDDATAAAALRLAERGVSAVVVCGAALVGIARRLQPRLPCLVFDGGASSVAAALDGIVSGVRRAIIRPLGVSRGLDPALAALLAGQGPAAAPISRYAADLA